MIGWPKAVVNYETGRGCERGKCERTAEIDDPPQCAVQFRLESRRIIDHHPARTGGHKTDNADRIQGRCGVATVDKVDVYGIVRGHADRFEGHSDQHSQYKK